MIQSHPQISLRTLIIWLGVAFFFLPAVQLQAQQEQVTTIDTVLEKFNIEELLKLKEYLENYREKLMQEQTIEQQKGIEISQEFLQKTRTDIENQDQILIRIAEYYIEEEADNYQMAVEAYNATYDRYEQELQEFQDGKRKVEPEAPKFPRRNYDKAIAIYDIILVNFPESDLADDAVYNKAFLLREMGEEEASQIIYEELIDKYPESNYVPEAYMHLAEFYFQPKLGQDREETIRNLNKAAQLYKNILKYKESSRYTDALYKLGWTYYRLAGANPLHYNDAILYFTMVVQDIEKFETIDREGRMVKANIKPEALQYIAACFVDTSYTLTGVSKAENYIEGLGRPSFGVDILANMGDLYARIVDHPNSISAYSTLLRMYPDYAYAPLIQKKIADVYLEDQKINEAYIARESLFENYNPKTDWYAKIEVSDMEDRVLIVDQATNFSEQALRTNLIYQLARAQEYERAKTDSISTYTEFARLAKLYLETYPTHENAYEINWSQAYVLDTELKRYPEALEEYLRVSNDYLEEVHRKDAANNAIVVAQFLVQSTRTAEDTVQIGGIDVSQVPPSELATEEQALGEAYDNYIKLFPEDERTATYLASAGSLYYSHRQYDLARKYYKTMVTKFPESQQRTIGLLSLMNSYFFLGKFSDAEFVARKIVDLPDIPPDQVEIARKRIGESIYKNAEKLEQEEKYLEAAQEFFRVYTDASYYKEIVDLALLNSARNYELNKEWRQAISMYDTLVVNYEQSQYRLIALGKIADAYKQMEDFNGVGASYERIYNLYPDHKDAEAALYNSSLFYAKASSWLDAIRVNNKYIQRYPDNPDSKDLLFENARYYLKLDDLTNANRIYDEFAMRYPDDPRTIEAYFRRGEYYYENQQFSQARIELQKAISRSDQFARTGRDPNLFFASESYFMLGEIEYVDYKNITLSYPEATLRSQLQQKQNKLRAVIDAFTTVIKMGSLKGFEAMFKVAEAYEELGNAIAEQQLTPNLTPERRLVERDRVFKASVPAYDRAVEEYKNVIENIPVYAQKLEVNIFDTTSVAPVDTAGLQDSPEVIQKVAFQDSTRDIALKWYNESRVKVSSILYTVAERSTEFIDAYLRQENPARGLVYLSWKKLLLERAVAPAVNVTLTSHLKNITISKELNLQNKFVNESERKILLTSNVLAEEYGKLFKNAVQQYQTDMPTLYQLIEGGESATTPDGLNSMDFNDQLMSIIDYMNEFITTGLTQFTNTLKFAQDNQINNDAVLTTQDHLFNLSYESGITMLGLSQNVNSKIKEYEVIADSTGDQKYQLGIVYLYDQESILNDYAKQQLADVYQISKDYEIKNVWTNLILAKLVELSPADYLSDFPSEILTFTSGPDWNGSAIYALDWITSEFNDSEWKNVSVVTLPTTMIFPGFDSLQTPPPSIWLFTDISLADSLTTLQPPPVSVDTLLPSDSVPRPRSLDLEEKEIPEEMTTTPRTLLSESGTLPVATAPDTVTAYFRKKFNLQDRVINGYALITADNQYHFYLNGEYIKGNENNLFESVDRVEYIELGDFVKTGENLIAIDVTDINGAPHYGVRFYLQLEILPLEITAAAERIRQKAAENVDENQLRTIVVLNKNRVPAK